MPPEDYRETTETTLLDKLAKAQHLFESADLDPSEVYGVIFDDGQAFEIKAGVVSPIDLNTIQTDVG